MNEIQVGQYYKARPLYTAMESGASRGVKQPKLRTGRVIHVNQAHGHVTLEFQAPMGPIRETIRISDLGKQARTGRKTQ